MREKKIENQIKKYLKEVDAYYFKHHGGRYSQVGVPDIVGCYKSRFFGIEVKNETGKLSPLQVYNLQQIAKNGGIALAVRNISDVKEVFEDDKTITIPTGILKIR